MVMMMVVMTMIAAVVVMRIAAAASDVHLCGQPFEKPELVNVDGYRTRF